MSTDYRPLGVIGFSDLKKHAKDMGMTAHIKLEGCDKDSFALSGPDGDYLWVFRYDGNKVGSFQRCGSNNVDDMIDTISKYFEVDILSDRDSGYHDDKFTDDEKE